MALENIVGNLRDAYKQAQPGTILCVDQLMNERRSNPDLRNNWFYTADGNVYTPDGNTLLITREAANPILRNIDDAYTQLVQAGNFKVSTADLQAVRDAPDTVAVLLRELKLSGDNNEWRYLAIDTKKYDKKLNPEARKLAERVFGQGTDFTANMKMLRDAGITETRIYVLNPNYVTENAKGQAIGRASWLNDFSGSSDFSASDGDVSINGRLRGVRREASVSEPSAPLGADAQKVIVPTLDQVLACLGEDLAPSVRPAVEGRIRKLYEV